MKQPHPKGCGLVVSKGSEGLQEATLVGLVTVPSLVVTTSALASTPRELHLRLVSLREFKLVELKPETVNARVVLSAVRLLEGSDDTTTSVIADRTAQVRFGEVEPIEY